MTRNYGYDKLHRLVSETASNETLVHPSRVISLAYSYDADGPFHAPKVLSAAGAEHAPSTI